MIDAPSKPVRLLPFVLLALGLGVAVMAVLHAIPPRTITIETGPIDGSYHEIALHYRDALEKRGIGVRLLPKTDSLDIIADVDRDEADVDVGFTAQEIKAQQFPRTVSAGAIELQPLFMLYNIDLGEIASTTNLRGKRLVMPPLRSATTEAAMRVLRLFDVTPANTNITFAPLVDLVRALKAGDFDAGVVMLEPANPLIGSLVTDDNLRLLGMSDGLAVTRRMPFLRTTIVPRGSYNTEANVPPNNVELLAATVNVVVRKDIHPAVLYTLLEAMNEVHYGTTLINSAGEFPSFIRTDLPLHPLAAGYAKNGTPWIYLNLPLWLASLIDYYLVIGIAIFVVTEVYKSSKYLGELVTVIAEDVCLRFLVRIERGIEAGHKASAFRMFVVRVAERSLSKSSKRVRSQEMIVRIRANADPKG